MSEILAFPPNTQIKKINLSRLADDPLSLNILFSRAPTDAEMLLLDEALEMIVNLAGLTQKA